MTDTPTTNREHEFIIPSCELLPDATGKMRVIVTGDIATVQQQTSSGWADAVTVGAEPDVAPDNPVYQFQRASYTAGSTTAYYERAPNSKRDGWPDTVIVTGVRLSSGLTGPGSFEIAIRKVEAMEAAT